MPRSRTLDIHERSQFLQLLMLVTNVLISLAEASNKLNLVAGYNLIILVSDVEPECGCSRLKFIWFKLL